MKYWLVCLLIMVSLFDVSGVSAAKTNDPPLPYTTPKVSYQHTMVRISWYNITPKVYTVVERYERCTPHYCIDFMKVHYKKFFGIGNVRINIRQKVNGHISVY